MVIRRLLIWGFEAIHPFSSFTAHVYICPQSTNAGAGQVHQAHHDGDQARAGVLSRRGLSPGKHRNKHPLKHLQMLIHQGWSPVWLVVESGRLPKPPSSRFNVPSWFLPIAPNTTRGTAIPREGRAVRDRPECGQELHRPHPLLRVI